MDYFYLRNKFGFFFSNVTLLLVYSDRAKLINDSRAIKMNTMHIFFFFFFELKTSLIANNNKPNFIDRITFMISD